MSDEYHAIVDNKMIIIDAVQFTDNRTGMEWWAPPDAIVRYVRGELSTDELVAMSAREKPAETQRYSDYIWIAQV